MTELAARPREDRASLGIAMMLLAWLCFSVVDTSVKWLVIAGLPALQLSFMRYFVHFLLSGALLSRTGLENFRPPRSHRGLLLLRSALLVSSTVSNFIALNYLSLTMTSAIMFSSPIIVSALSVPLLGERVGPWRWFAILLGFSGVLIVIRPFGANFTWFALLSVYNAVAMANFSIITRKLSGVIPSETMQFYTGALGAAVLLPAAIWVWQPPASYLDWFLFLGLGFWGWLGHELFVRAHGFAEANALMPYAYSFIVYLAITGYLVFGDVPDLFTVIGALIIMLSGLLIWWRENLRRLR